MKRRIDNVSTRNEDYIINKTDQTYTAPFDRVQEESDSDEFDRSDDEDVAGLGLFAQNTKDDYFVGSVENKVGKAHLIEESKI